MKIQVNYYFRVQFDMDIIIQIGSVLLPDNVNSIL